MERIEIPMALRLRGFQSWPEIYRVGKNEPNPPVGIPFLIAEEVDFPLIFRLLIPVLKKQHSYFDWEEIYQSMVGLPYEQQRIYQVNTVGDVGHQTCDGCVETHEPMTLRQLGMDRMSYIDLDLLADLAMIPKFMTDIREAIRVNVTNSYMWQDGYNKKTGVCSGYLTEQPKPRNLVIVDLSHSIPDGVSAGLLTLIKTITDIVSADLILTGGVSFFYPLDEVRQLDIDEVRKSIPRSNESIYFNRILKNNNMDYDTVIVFGDSDRPNPLDKPLRINTTKLYNFFIGKVDCYGHSYKSVAGYGRWVVEARPNVEIIHNYEWAKFFNDSRL